MFADFANVWTIVGATSDLPAGKLRPLTVAGERVVMFRDATGRASALIDRCPHRGVRLSLGTLCDGIVECPFHGWRFDGTGANRLVPWNPDARRGALGAIALPMEERNGLLWLHTGQSTRDQPAVPTSLASPGTLHTAQSVLWRCHWTRAMENMLDMPHLPFVHRATIGRALAAGETRRMTVAWHPTDTGARLEGMIEGRERMTRLDYWFPNAMELLIDPPGKLLRVVAVCLPETAETTRMIFLSVRDFARSALLNPIFRYSNRRIAREDQAILESSWPAEVPAAGEERSVATDAPTLAFRKLYFERLKGTIA